MALDVQNTIDTATQNSRGQRNLMTPPLYGPQEIAREAVQTTTPVQEVGSISAEKGIDQVKQADQKLNDLQNRKTPQEQLTDIEKQAKDIQAILDKRKEAPIDTRVTVDEQGDTITVPEDPAVVTAKKEAQNAEDTLIGYMNQLQDLAINDKELNSTFNSIRRVYGARVDAMERINKSRQDAIRTLGVRLGSRYTGGTKGGVFGGVIAEEERQGLERINAIESEMLGEIDKAKAAAREFNYSLYTDAVNKAEKLYKDKQQAAKDLEDAVKESQKQIQEEEERITNQSSVIEQISNGTTDPMEIFTALGGNVPFDMIKEITDTLPGEKDTKPVTLGSYDILVDPVTGNVIARGGKLGGDTTLNVSSNGGLSVGESRGVATVSGLGTTYENSTGDAKFAIERIFNGLPTQLKNNVAEHPLWKNSILNYLKNGYTEQEIKDELSGFALFGGADKDLGYTLFNLSKNTDIAPEELSGLINRGADKQAMLMVENSQLNDVQLFFANVDEARGYVDATQKALNLLNRPDFPTRFLGSYDGRKFKATRFLGKDANDKERQMLQQLETQLAIINAPIRVSVAGVAVTPTEMDKIQPFQADILDNPGTMDTILTQLQNSVLDFHNSARQQRGLPTVDAQTILNEDSRLNLYKDMATVSSGVSYTQMNNDQLLNPDKAPSDFNDPNGIYE